MVIDTEAVKYVPLDAVAFIMELKQSLTKENLERSLQKFSKLVKLPVSQRRAPVTISGRTRVDRSYIP